jgi:predicted ATPase
LRLAQAVPLIAVHGYGAQAVEFCASRAKELGDHLPGWEGHFAVRRLVWNSHMLRHPMPRTISLARDLLSFAERSGNPAQIAVACRALGFSLLFAGELVEADLLLARGAILADGVEATAFAAYGENPSILCRVGGGWVRSLMGSPDTALHMIGEGLARARASSNPHPISWALGILAVAHKLRGDACSTRRAAAEAVEVAAQHSLPQWLGFAELWLGWALCRLGQRAEGLALLQVAQRRLRDTGAILFTVMSNCVFAEASVSASRPETALEHLAAAQEHAERNGEGFMLAEIHRLHATALCALNAPASECERRLRNALGIAQRQGAKTWELRAAVDLARLWRDQCRITDAHDVLALVYASFTEGFNLPDLMEAKSLLDELNAAACD